MDKTERDIALLFAGFNEIMALYSEIDGAVAAFARSSGLACLASCGSCCEGPSARIEATVLEMLPLAVHLWRAGRAERWIEIARLASPLDSCVLYDRADIAAFDGLCGEGGGCGAYPLRPGVCRLFGFAAVGDKFGVAQMGVCRLVRDARPALADAVAARVRGGLKAPMFSDYAMRVLSIDPALGAARCPINEALSRALEAVALKLDLSARSSGFTSPRPQG